MYSIERILLYTLAIVNIIVIARLRHYYRKDMEKTQRFQDMLDSWHEKQKSNPEQIEDGQKSTN